MGTVTAAERAALSRAVELAKRGPRTGGNPRVGCVLLTSDGRTIAEGWHEGAGTPHAEVMALSLAGPHAKGATAVVSLEPCNHTGRTGPCSVALAEAGVVRVVYGQPDPNPEAFGGAEFLAAQGISVEYCELDDTGLDLNRTWSFAVTHGRPWVILKAGTTLDGRIAAADGTSQWITSAEARRDAHELRSEVDAILVGTGTVLADDPSLTVRLDGFTGSPPLRVVMGNRGLPAGARILDDQAETLVVATHDPAAVLAELFARGVRRLMIEGGATVAAAFMRAGLVDDLRWYVAPLVLGAGPAAVADFGVSTLADGIRLNVVNMARVGSDVRIDAEVVRQDMTEGA